MGNPFHPSKKYEIICHKPRLSPITMLPKPEMIFFAYDFLVGHSGGSDSKESTYDAGDPNSVSGLGRSPGGGNGNLFQYSFLENAMDRGA